MQDASDNNVLMEQEEIEGELLLELVKGIQYYEGKGYTPARMEKVLKQMLRNRIAELRYKYYVASRKEESMAMRLDQDIYDGEDSVFGDIVPSIDMIPDEEMSSKNRVLDTRSKLSDTARLVFDAIVYGNTQLALSVYMSTLRASVTMDATTKIRYFNVSQALGISESVVAKSYREIKLAYAEVLNG